jgi:hypothetical protein
MSRIRSLWYFHLGWFLLALTAVKRSEAVRAPIHTFPLLIYLWVRDQLNIKVISESSFAMALTLPVSVMYTSPT